MLQVIRYGIVGVVNTTVDYAVLNICLLLFGLSLFWATFFGFAAGGLVGYFLHSRWTFRYNTSGKEMKKLSHFLCIAVIGLSLTEIIVHIFTNKYGFYYNYSKTIALVVSIAWAYSASKWWVFRNIEEPPVA
ncbi:MAG: hypothetical protein A3D99_02050 [Candidatus Andersenbacteria bacterium RIFCSPHIGHO2_12_FULL_45_11]|uniref:GtrA/DPMS transmembrane domain-containing protein n=1 Tax=Candidatus Andersenbacteria bacterium RIFCSPHIGHO2_12_FULL_45_11 TaxID=1797281 RepID=A0A1G1X296_9BACT|nr:MAG: hypothetical protein A3D99_02050 [Candidatus Andersenbacteria bacterium RIFCSPHIGHO2_12_FULL_45_11]